MAKDEDLKLTLGDLEASTLEVPGLPQAGLPQRVRLPLDAREASDSARTVAALREVEGKRLEYGD